MTWGAVTHDLKEAIEGAEIDLCFAAAELCAACSDEAAILHMEQAAERLISAARSWRDGRAAWLPAVRESE